ncbi:methyltransferase domain-containing protein [Microtetraspora sp. NBRC 16547]|uniref:methyltransferase domain-containing protein n=1 Tax=Microtetraspora sp. NBRC 16547 TaxID=3030993 RepID=UPI0024A0F9AC|nr:methyltransferase domain-containing protein [Microtetraspora sp. NBRC 16547]GLW99142.1 methyltransferase [Microtetraspora sp. NBRC 16547]
MSNDFNTNGKHDAVDELIRLLDAVDSRPGSAEFRARSYELLQLAPGVSAVDVGCGSGLAVEELAGRDVRAIGIDHSERVIDAARRRRPHADLRIGDACRLPFHDGELAGYRADKVYHELDDPARALAEARRVLASGGHVVLIGQDWDTVVIDSDDPLLTRTIVHARADTVAAPRAARRYRNLLLDGGFDDVTVEAYTAVFTDATMLPMASGMAHAACTAGAVTEERAAAWAAEQAERARTGRLFLAVPLFMAAGRRP